MRKWGFVAFLCSGLIALTLLLATNKGACWLIRTLLPLTTLPLTVNQIKGTVLEGLSLSDLHFKGSTDTVSAKNVRFTWQPQQLLYGHLVIDSLVVDQLSFSHVATALKTAPFRAFKWSPYWPTLIVKQLTIRQLHLALPQVVDVQTLQAAVHIDLYGMNGFVHMQSGSAHVLINSLLSEKTIDCQWQVAIPALQVFLSKAHGSIQSVGVWHSQRDRYALHGSVNMQHVHTQALQIEHLLAKVDFHSAQPSQVNVDGQRLQWAGYRMDRAVIKSFGDYRQQTLQVDIASLAGKLHAEWLGAFQHGQWQGLWQQLAIKAAKQPIWMLKESVPLIVSMSQWRMAKPLCLSQQRQFLCVQANWQGQEAWRFQLRSSPLAFSEWSWLMPTMWSFSGTLQAAIDLTAHGSALPTGEIHFNGNDLRVHYQPHKTVFHVDLGQWQALAQLKAKDAQLSVKLKGAWGAWQGTGQMLKWQGLLSDWRQQRVQGMVQGQLTRLPTALSFAKLQALQGLLNVKLAISGVLSQPVLGLNIALTEASVRLPDYNIVLKPLGLSLIGDPLKQLTLRGMMQSGVGSVKLQGTVDQLFDEPRINLSLQGQNFLASHLASYEVTVSPDLHLLYQASHLSLTGTLLIPTAQLRFVDYQKSVVRLSSDVSYVDTDESPLDFVSDLTVRLGERVMLQYGGLKGRVTGSVRLHDALNQPTSGVGQLQLVDATYQAFGQLFSISQGLAQFKGGAVINPWLTIEAARKLTYVVPVSETGAVIQSQAISGVNNDLVVGVAIKGPLQTSQIKLFSQPSGLSQADILSYLLLGRPVSEATGGNAQMLMSAASLLNNGSGPILQLQQQLKASLGLEVDVGATSQYANDNQTVLQNTSVILGKALSPRLFLNYSIGIAQPVNVLRLTYKISSKWSAQTETSSLGNGGDVFYTLDRY